VTGEPGRNNDENGQFLGKQRRAGLVPNERAVFQARGQSPTSAPQETDAACSSAYLNRAQRKSAILPILFETKLSQIGTVRRIQNGARRTVLPALAMVFLSIFVASGEEQIPIARVDMMPNLPRPYLMRDWKQVTRDYDATVFNTNPDRPRYLWWNRRHLLNRANGFGLPAYVFSEGEEIVMGESINCAAAVLGASLVLLRADQWARAVQLTDGRFYDMTTFDFMHMRPVDTGKWREPDAPAGIAWLEYMAWKRTGEAKYLAAMKNLQQLPTNPFYEILLPYGAYLAARMNAEQGCSYGSSSIGALVPPKTLRNAGGALGEWSRRIGAARIVTAWSAALRTAAATLSP